MMHIVGAELNPLINISMIIVSIFLIISILLQSKELDSVVWQVAIPVVFTLSDAVLRK